MTERIAERLTDEERQAVIAMAITLFARAAPIDRAMWKEIVRKFSGVDTVVYIGHGTWDPDGLPESLDLTARTLLAKDFCPDCKRQHLVRGPQGGICVNWACRHCGHEFNVACHDGEVIMAHRNPPDGTINRDRLRRVFGIEKILKEGKE